MVPPKGFCFGAPQGYTLRIAGIGLPALTAMQAIMIKLVMWSKNDLFEPATVSPDIYIIVNAYGQSLLTMLSFHPQVLPTV